MDSHKQRIDWVAVSVEFVTEKLTENRKAHQCQHRETLQAGGLPLATCEFAHGFVILYCPTISRNSHCFLLCSPQSRVNYITSWSFRLQDHFPEF